MWYEVHIGTIITGNKGIDNHSVTVRIFIFNSSNFHFFALATENTGEQLYFS